MSLQLEPELFGRRARGPSGSSYVIGELEIAPKAGRFFSIRMQLAGHINICVHYLVELI